MRTSRGSNHHDQTTGTRCMTRAGLGCLLALAVLPGAECPAASPTLADVAGSASTADLLTRNTDQWNALERVSEEQEGQRLRAALAPEQWIAVPISRRRGPHRAPR